MATCSVPASESYLLLAREIYQTRLSEPLLVGLPILAHIASGVALRLLRRHQNLKRYGGATPGVYALHRSKAAVTSPSGAPSATAATAPHIWPPMSYTSASGYAFAALLGSHILLNRVLPLLVEGDSSNIGLAYVAHGFARHSTVAWLAYMSLIVVGAGHMVWGWARWLGLAQRASWQSNVRAASPGAEGKTLLKRRRRFWLGIHGVAVSVAALWAAGGLGVVARGGLMQGWVGKVYDRLYARVGL